MADPVSLAGTIGTWVAVLFAILALVGVVSPLLIYFNIRDQRGIALNAVDDRNHTYLGRGIRAWDKKRAFRRVNAPILRNSPQIEDLEAKKPAKDNQQRTVSSTTGWVMFSNVIRESQFSIKYGDSLAFENGESFLPVHMDWVLIIALLGRYGNREDHGVGIGTLANIPAAFLRASPREYIKLYGNTGAMLVAKRPSPTNRSVIYFQSHYVDRPRSEDSGVLVDEKESFKSLLALYLGCFLTNDGAFCKFSVRSIFASTRYQGMTDDSSVTLFRLHLLTEKDWDSAELSLIRRLGVKDVRLYQFVKSRHRIDEIGADCIRRVGNVKFHKFDLFRVYFWLLTMQWSPRSFLFGDDDPRGHTRFLRRIFYCPDDLATVLSAAADALSLHRDGQNLSKLIKMINTVDSGIDIIADEIPFRRSTSRYWHGLDRALRRFCGKINPAMLAVSILCVDNRELSSRIMRGWRASYNQSKPIEEFPSAVVDMGANRVTFPYEGSADGLWYFFDFNAVFPPSYIRSSQPKTTLPYTLCVVAYAQAKLREVMFRMLLKASDLKDALSIPNEEFFFADSTRGIRLVPLEDPSEETVHVLRRRSDTGSRDSLPLPYPPPPVE